jgi:transposase
LGARWKATGTIGAKPSGGRVPPLEDHAAFLLRLVTEQPDLTLEEIVAAMAKGGIAGSCTTVRRFDKRHGFSFREEALYAEEQKRAEVARAHQRWIREQSLRGPAQLVIDETCTSTGMARLRERSARGRRLIGYRHGRRRITTFVARLRLRAVTAPFVLDSAMNGRMFPAYAKQPPALRLARKEIAIMGNLPTHEIAGVQETIAAAGATPCYVPRYLPDLNPFEMAFSKFEAPLRKAAKPTIPGLLRRIGRVIKSFNPTERRNFLHHAGCVQT